MSNTGLISRMRRLLDEYEAGRLSPEQVERAIDYHINGVEGIGLPVIHEARNLTHRLVTAHMSVGTEEFIEAEEVSQAPSDMRRFLRSLPGGVDA
jgi:hypothetical protein